MLAFDQIGFGTRVEHAKEFYRRYPEWSLLGKMVADTKAAITAASALEIVDSSADLPAWLRSGRQGGALDSRSRRRPKGAVA